MPAAPSPLGDLLARRTREGELYEKLPEGRVRCFACGHRCLIPPGRDGDLPRALQRGRHAAGARSATWARCSVDPVEKKPFFHALPGAAPSPSACSAATTTAATARTGSRRRRCAIPDAVAPPQDVDRGRARRAWPASTGARIVTSTYNEPLITSEWAVAVFREAQRRGPRLLVRLQRQRHAGGARLHPALGLALQGRPQELPRPPLPRAGRHAGARALDHPRAPRARHLGRGRHAASCPASTTRTRS